MLEKQHQIPAATLNRNLTIIQGSILDIAPVKETLAPKGMPAKVIVCGVGAGPKVQMNPIHPLVMDQPTICGDASANILSALRALRREGTISEQQKPVICVVSTTGISKSRDVPHALMPLYHVMLKTPHIDKRIMESNIARASAETGAEAPIDNFVIVRPTLLMDGKPLGLQKVKSGWENHHDAPDAVEETAPGPKMGYSIRRADVGAWIYENVIKSVGEGCKGKCYSLTY